ncbi:sulfotransferase family protein [Ruegeria sediminis]|uniref:Sulfotransferase family protein n=2 Tax=Ruegeria sediminis TaxID=2583820 RepID=A0ABY2WX43_9RHOB|nr:sulfotransferase family protein [Ruegeria sediminis]
MILSDRYRFVFVHVPKCAGTSVREAVLPFHDADTRFLKTVEHHSELGDIDYRHLPLKLLRDLDSEAFAKLKTYESYALLRDPFQRFRSAMSQRAKMYLGKEFAQLDDNEIRAEIEQVKTYLQSEPKVLEPGFIHFSRQSDYVWLDGQKLIKNLYPVERLDLLLAALARQIGTDSLKAGHANRTKVFRHPGLKRIMYGSAALSRRLLPSAVHEKLRTSARRMLMKAGTSQSSPVFGERHVKNFIRDYYAADLAMYRCVLAGVS